MTTVFAALGPFGDAIEFIFQQRESQAGTVQVGGLAEIWELTWMHLKLSLAATAIATLVALPIGVWLGHIGRYQFLAISTSNIGRAVPALGLVVFFIAFLGVGFGNVCLALVLLAIPPIITNAYVGIRGVDPETVDAAKGNGLTGMQIAGRVELPLALPTIMAGIRIALVSVIATATIAPLANVDTLGRPIVSPNVYGTAGQLAACIVVALVTFAADAAMAALQRAVTPRGTQDPSQPGPVPWPAIRVPQEEHPVDMKRTNPILALLAILCLGLAFAACGDDESSTSGGGSSSSGSDSASGNEIQKVDGAEGKTISVGSKNFTEQFVLGEIYSQALEAAGFKVKKQLDLGSELLAYKALQAGKVDAYPEYTGTALTSFFGVKTADVPRDAQKAYEDTKAGFAEKQITALAPTPFENTYRLGMTKEGAAKIGDPTKISDLSEHDQDLSISGFPECKQRQDCLLGVEDTYGLKFKKFVTSEQKYQVLDSGDADVAFIFTTDGDLASGKYVILDDDKKFFPPYNITFAIRDEALKTIGPDGQKVIEDVQKPLTEKVMQELNARVDVDKQKPEEVAKAYLQSAGFIPKS